MDELQNRRFALAQSWPFRQIGRGKLRHYAEARDLMPEKFE